MVKLFAGAVPAAAVVVAVAGTVAAAGATSAARASTPAAAVTATPARPPVAPRAQLQRALDSVVAAGAVGAQAEVIDEAGHWVGVSGRARLNGRQPMPAGGLFRAGSITKTFTATVLLQLVEEKLVGLDDPIERYLPGLVPNGKNITVTQILNHTSGLHEYLDDEAFPLEGEDFLTKLRFRTFTTEQLVRVSTGKPPDFEPGKRWAYTNTGYALARLIIEKVTGHSYSKEIRQRILQPLRLRHTSLPGTRTFIPGPHAHGYLKITTNGRTRSVDVTRLNPSWGGAAGEIISTTTDLNRFYTNLLNGTLLRPAQLSAMKTFHETGDKTFRYGLGLANRTLPCKTTVNGHDGGIHAFSTYSFHSPDGRRHFNLSVTMPDYFNEATQPIGIAQENAMTTTFCGTPTPN